MEGKMNCDEYKNLITVSVYGKLTPEEKSRLEVHLRDCSRCANIYERSEKLSDLNNQKDNIPLPDKEKAWQIITQGDNIQPRSEQTSPLVDIALTLVRHINRSDVY